MEMLQGETLQQRLTRGPLDTNAIVDVGLALADALDAIHGRDTSTATWNRQIS